MPTSPADDAAALQDTAASRLWPVWQTAVQQARMNPEAEVPNRLLIALELAAVATVAAAWASQRRRATVEVPTTLDQYDVRVEAQRITDAMAPKVWGAAVQHVRAQAPETDARFARQASYSSSAELMSRGQMAFAQELGLKYKVWISRGDAKVRQLHRELHGKAVELNRPFRRWGTSQSLSYPGDPQAPLDAIINCRCLMMMVDSKAGILEALAPSNLTNAFTLAASLEAHWCHDDD